MDTITARGILERDIVQQRAEKNFNARLYVQHLSTLEDSLVTATTTEDIQNWLGNFDSRRSDYAQVDHEYDRIATGNVLSRLDTIEARRDPCEEGYIEHRHLRRLYQILQDIENDNRNERMLTEAELDSMEYFATQGEGTAQIRAQNLLHFFYGIEYPFEIQLPESGEGAESNAAKEGGNITRENMPDEVFLIISPNPATDVLNITYAAPSIYGNNGKIRIADTRGKEMFVATIDEQNEQFEINTTTWPTGMYFCVYSGNSSYRKSVPVFILR